VPVCGYDFLSIFAYRMFLNLLLHYRAVSLCCR